MGVTKALMAATGNVAPRIVAATGSDRTARVLRAGAAPVVVGAPAQLLGLLAASALKLDGLRTVVIAWAEEILAAGASHDLDTLLTEVPKEAYRVVVSAEISPAVEDFIERHRPSSAPTVGVRPPLRLARARSAGGRALSSPVAAPSVPSSKAARGCSGAPRGGGICSSQRPRHDRRHCAPCSIRSIPLRLRFMSARTRVSARHGRQSRHSAIAAQKPPCACSADLRANTRPCWSFTTCRSTGRSGAPLRVAGRHG